MPTQITCTRKFSVDAGHRVYLHESKCNNIHGHTYSIHCEASAPNLDKLGRVIDFGQIKSLLGTWLDENWDHGMILNSDDPLLKIWAEMKDQKYYVLPSMNPTAENMAEFLLNAICPVLFKDTSITITSITVWETPNCCACAKLTKV